MNAFKRLPIFIFTLLMILMAVWLFYGLFGDRFIKLGSFEFLVGEFNGSQTPEVLIQAIKTGSKIDFGAVKTPIESLNELLKRQDLYKVMTNRPDEAKDLISRLELGQQLSSLELKRLNRVLIETNYPLETPKRLKLIYEGKSGGLLNSFIHGRDVHPVEYYLELGRAGVKKFSVYTIFICLVIIFFNFLRSSPDVRAVLVGIFLCFILIFAVEIILYVCKVGKGSYIEKHPPRYGMRTDFGVKRLFPGRHRVFATARKTGRMIFDVQYSIDEYGRRITPIEGSGKRDKFILFFGCSFTHGHGVEDSQTLSSYVGDNADVFMPYNYGFNGLGPFDVLAQIENINFQNEVGEENGILVYVFMDDHVRRTIGSSSLMTWKSRDVYYRQTKDGRLVRAGSFLTGRPFLTSIYGILSKSRILRVLDIGFPIRIRDPHIKLVAQTIRQMKQNFNMQYPQGEFYVLIYPGSRFGERLIGYLNGMGVRYLDYARLFFNNDPRFCLAREDSHPSASAYKTIAQEIVEDLKLDAR